MNRFNSHIHGPVPIWFIVMMSIIWHIIITSLLSLFIWGIVRTFNKLMANYLTNFLSILIAGFFGMLPFIIGRINSTGSTISVYSYSFSLAIGSAVALYLSSKKAKKIPVN